MYSEQEQEKFYKWIKEKKKEIKNLDLPEDKRNKLNLWANKAVERAARDRIWYLNCRIHSLKIGKRNYKLLRTLENGLEEIKNGGKEISSILGNIKERAKKPRLIYTNERGRLN